MQNNQFNNKPSRAANPGRKKVTILPKLLKLAQTDATAVRIPQDTQTFLGWKQGDTVVIDSNKEKDQIIITRINKEE